MTEEQRKKIQEQFDRFCWREYRQDAEEIPDTGVIPVCFTTYEFDEDSKYTHEIQINFDLDSMCWLNHIDDELVLTQQSSIDSFISDLSVCSFDEIIHDCVMEGFRLQEEGHFERLNREIV